MSNETKSLWVQTFSGLAFDLLSPTIEQVRLVDIAHSLSRLNRFCGATKGTYGWSVAQHSMLVESLLPPYVDPILRLHVMLHDAHEAYIGDITTPVRRAIRYYAGDSDPLYYLESMIDSVVWRAFALDPPTEAQRDAIKHVDALALKVERFALLEPEPRDWGIPDPGEPPTDFDTILTLPRHPGSAKQAFIARFLDLIDMRHGTAA